MNLQVMITTTAIDFIYDPHLSAQDDEAMYLYMDLKGHRVAVPNSLTNFYNAKDDYVCVGLLDMRYKALSSTGIKVAANF